MQMRMSSIAKSLSAADYILRSGHAHGADLAFERGSSKSEIFLPWDGFNGAHFDNETYFGYSENAITVAKLYHPNWPALSRAGRAFHTRNVHQVLGHDLHTPAEFVVCWTEDGKDSGGTGQAIRIARDKGIPVYNLFNPDESDSFDNLLGGLI